MQGRPSSDGQQRRSGGQTRRWLAWGLGGLAALAVLLVAVATAAVHTPWGTRLLWQAASSMVPGQLSGELVGGTLRDGVGLRNIVFQNDSVQVRIDRLDGAWRLTRAPWKLVVHYLHAGTADVTVLPTPPTPRALPQQLALPLAIDLEDASLQQLVIRQGAGGEPSRFNNIRLKAAYDGIQHVVTLRHADTPAGLATGTLQVKDTAPFAVAGAASLATQYGNASYRLDTRLSGSLQALGLQIDVSGKDLQGAATVDATPFEAIPVRRAQVAVRGLDPRAFNTQWPHAKLDMQAALTPSGKADGDLSQLTVSGAVSLRNAQPGPINRGLLPLDSASAKVSLGARAQRIEQLRIRLPGRASVEGSGSAQGATEARLTLQAYDLNLNALHTGLKPSQLSGPLTVQTEGDTQQLDLKLAGPALSVSAQARLDPHTMVLHAAQLRAGSAQLALTGRLARDARAAYAVSGSLRDFDPALLFAATPGASRRPARINTEFSAQGALQPTLSAQVGFTVHDSQYDGIPMTGGGTVRLSGTQLLPSEAQLSIAGNSVQLKGSFSTPSDRLALDIHAPALQRLGFGLSGMLQLHGTVGGTLDRPALDMQYRAENLALGAHRLASLSGAANTQGVPGKTPNARVVLNLEARGLHSGDLQLSKLSASVDGTYAEHAVRASADGRVRNQPLQMVLAASGRLHEQAQGLAWDGVLRTLENRSAPRIQLDSPLTLAVAPGRIALGSGRIAFGTSSIRLQNLVYNQSQLRSEGSVQAMDVGQLLALWQQFSGQASGLATDLVLDGRWNLTLADRADGFVDISRRGGDVRLAGQSALGLDALALHAKLQDSRIALDARASASRVGSVTATGQIGLQREDGRLTFTPRATLSGRIAASLPQLQTIAAWAGPSIALGGSASMDVTVGGTLGEPLLSGTVAGNRLGLTLYDQGVRLRDGVARLRLDKNIVELQQLEFHGGEGTLRASGRVALGGTARNLSATIVASKLQLLASPSAQLTISGQAVASSAGGQLLVKGRFDVDQGLFSLPEKSAPQLDADVVVVRRGQAQAARGPGLPPERPAGALTPRIDIELGLGNNLVFKGSGAKLRLAGALNLRSEPGATPQAFGTVRVVDGSYETFGAQLAIESGILNFQGSLRNPNLNILAMRRQQDVAAGVRVTGTVRSPRVQLVSEPELPQEQQLSWLVFGRGDGAGEAGQAQSAVHGAAVGLLNKFGAGRAARSLGLDTLAIGESKFGMTGAQVVSLGKEISERLYIGYEQSLSGAESVLKLVYELTPHWSVVLRGGAVASVDVLYNRRFDRLRGTPQ